MKKLKQLGLWVIILLMITGSSHATDRSIQYNELLVGANHPSKTDTINRITLAEHDNTGAHRWVDVGNPDYTTIPAAIAFVATDNKFIYVHDAQTLSANATIPATSGLSIDRGGIITINNGVTLTINGPFSAGLSQVFNTVGTGKVVFGPSTVTEIYAQWWGALCDGSTDDAVAVQEAITAAATNNGTVVITNTCAVGSGGWVGLTLTSKSNVTIMGRNKGDGLKCLVQPSQTLSSFGVNYYTLLKLDTCSFITVKGLDIDLNDKDTIGIGIETGTSCLIEDNYIHDTTSGTSGGIYFAAGDRNRVLYNEFFNCYHGIFFGISNTGKDETNGLVEGNIVNSVKVDNHSGITGAYSKTQILNNTVLNAGGSGIVVQANTTKSVDSSEIIIADNYCSGCEFSGIQFDINGASFVAGVTIENNVLENNDLSGIDIWQGKNIVVEGNVCIDNNAAEGTNASIYVHAVGGDFEGVTITKNQIYDTRSGASRTAWDGIKVDCSTHNGKNVQIEGNYIHNHDNQGIRVVSAGTIFNLSITDNNCWSNDSWGISLAGPISTGTVSGNMLIDNDQATGSGDLLFNAAVIPGTFEVSGNIVTATLSNNALVVSSAQNLKNQKLSTSTTTGASVLTAFTMDLAEGDLVRLKATVVANTSASAQRTTYEREVLVYRAPAGAAVIQGGVFYPVIGRTGLSAISNGTTSIAVTHGLGGTPTVGQISIIGGENPSNDVGTIWVDTITATQFTVNCENDPGGSSFDFGWSALVGEIETDASYNCTWDAVGNTIRLKLTGKAATTIDWEVNITSIVSSI